MVSCGIPWYVCCASQFQDIKVTPWYCCLSIHFVRPSSLQGPLIRYSPPNGSTHPTKQPAETRANVSSWQEFPKALWSTISPTCQHLYVLCPCPWDETSLGLTKTPFLFELTNLASVQEPQSIHPEILIRYVSQSLPLCLYPALTWLQFKNMSCI